MINYIYDILLNFTDDKDNLEFFEWNDTDNFDHIKRIPIFKISSSKMKDLINSKIKLKTSYLKLIKNQTTTYKNIKNIKYSSLFCDSDKVIALEFNSKGETIYRSNLLLEEEEDILDEIISLKEEPITYKVLETYKKNNFLTRKENIKQKYLLNELKNLAKNKDYLKFNFLYEETFSKDNLTYKKRYLKFINEIENNYTTKFNNLYEIVRLTYIKNKL